MALGSLIIFISSALQAFGPEWYYLCAGRFFTGMVAGKLAWDHRGGAYLLPRRLALTDLLSCCTGIATGVVPTYLSEISPVRFRGGIGTIHQ